MKAFESKFGKNPLDNDLGFDDYFDWIELKRGWRAALEWALSKRGFYDRGPNGIQIEAIESFFLEKELEE